MYSLDLTPLFQYVNEAVLILLGGLALWLVSEASSWLRTHAKFLSEQTDATLTAGFNRALQNGINIAMQQLDQYEAAHSSVPVNSWIAEKAGQYALDHSPDFMKRFTGMSLDDAALKALAYLPTPQTTAGTTGAIVKSTPVQTEPLPPIEIPPGH